MKDLKYPAQQEHKKFVKDFTRLKTHMRKSGNVSLWPTQLEEFIRDWFVSHIQETDRKLADFLCKKPKADVGEKVNIDRNLFKVLAKAGSKIRFQQYCSYRSYFERLVF